MWLKYWRKALGVEIKPKSNVEETRERIIALAMQSFSSVGFEATSTRALAREAGINHSLILYHFKNKAGLWEAVMRDLFSSFAAFSQIPDESFTPVEQLRISLHRFVAFCAAHPELHRIMTIEGRVRTPRLSWLISHYLKDTFEETCAAIRLGQDQGLIRQGHPAQLYYACIGIAGTLATLAPEYEELSGESATSPEAITSACALIDALLFVA
jgi:TetR/AcrR family transcriptional regulator